MSPPTPSERAASEPLLPEPLEPASDAPTSAQVLRVIGPGRNSRWKRLTAAAALLTLIGIGIALTTWRRERTQTPAFNYVTEVARLGSLRATVTATGSVRAIDQVDVGSEVSGKVRSVFVDFNERVQKGQVLCEIDPETYQASHDQAKAQLAASRADVAHKLASAQEARIEAQRHLALGAEGLVTQQQVLAAQAALKRAEAAYQAALAQVGSTLAGLKSAKSTLDKTLIRSPIDGIVLSRQVEPGQTVVASFQAPVLFTLAKNLVEMEIDVLVDEADIGQVAEGQPATFSVDTYRSRKFPARLSTIHNTATIQNNVVSYEAILLVDNQEGLLRPGMTATVSITTGARDNVLLVPNAALRFTPPSAIPRSNEGPSLFRFGRSEKSAQSEKPEPQLNKPVRTARVWVLDAGTPKPVTVKTGLSDGTLTEIGSSALKPGAPVIVDMTLGG